VKYNGESPQKRGERLPTNVGASGEKLIRRNIGGYWVEEEGGDQLTEKGSRKCQLNELVWRKRRVTPVV